MLDARCDEEQIAGVERLAVAVVAQDAATADDDVHLILRVRRLTVRCDRHREKGARSPALQNIDEMRARRPGDLRFRVDEVEHAAAKLSLHASDCMVVRSMSKARILDAVQRLDIEAVRMLLDPKLALAEVRDRQDRNLLHVACCVQDARSLKMARFLLDRGFDIEAFSGRDRCTPLFFAVARARNPKFAKLLIDRGAKPSNAPGGALFAAAWWNDTKSLDLLLNAGAKIDVVLGITPFLAAWVWKHFDAAKFLATRGANVDAQDQKGRTALHLGIEKEYDPKLLRWLVGHGASPDVADKSGVTARVKASRKRDKRYLEALTALR